MKYGGIMSLEALNRRCRWRIKTAQRQCSCVPVSHCR